MCGIAGFFAFQGSRLSVQERTEILRAMGRSIEHRGPDDSQIYDDGFLSLAYQRLSIVDVQGGRQPLFNESGSTFIAMNGEIFNHVHLRSQLENRYRFASRSDSEAALHTLEEYGSEGLKRLNGMFSIALWNRHTKSLLLARDRMGVKPLYLCRIPGGVIFGSELKALLVHPACPNALDWTALKYGPLPRKSNTTYVKGVDSLPGGHFVEFTKDGNERIQAFWKLEEHLGSAPFGNNAKKYEQEYGDLIEDAIESHLIGEVPMALHLSGGSDSSLLAAVAAKYGHQLPCFTVVERTTLNAGDVKAAQKVTDTLKLPWHPVLFNSRTFVDQIGFNLARFEQSIWMMDSPRFDLEWIFKEELHRYSKSKVKGLKVTLLGQGADEFAGGYSKRLGSTTSTWEQYLQIEIADEIRAQQCTDAGIHEYLASFMKINHRQERGHGLYHQKMLQYHDQLKHYNLWHEDRSSSFQSIEARVPFLDFRVVELLASIPSELHKILFWDKQIVRSALRRHFPAYDCHRPKVGFFATDDTQSIENLVLKIAKRISAEFERAYLDDKDIPLDRDQLARLIRQVQKSEARPDNGDAAWQLMDCMALCIFNRQLQLRQTSAYDAIRKQRTNLKEVEISKWREVAQDLQFGQINADVLVKITPDAFIDEKVDQLAEEVPVRQWSLPKGFLGYFAGASEKTFAKEFTARLRKLIPVDSVISGNEKYKGKLQKNISLMQRELNEFIEKERLSFIKKTGLLNAIKWELLDAGYPNYFCDYFSIDLVMSRML